MPVTRSRFRLRRLLNPLVRKDGRPLSVLVVHLAPNNMPLWPIGEFVAATCDRYARRAAEVEYLQQMLRTRSLPTIVLWDCNMTDTSEAYAQLDTVLQDSFQERGWGLGHTLKIDRVPFRYNGLIMSGIHKISGS